MFFVVTEYFDVATELAKVRRNYIAIKQFYVTTKLARIGRIYVATEDFFCRVIMFLCCDRVWPNGEVLCCNWAILCRDIVGMTGKCFYHVRGFLCRD